MPSMSPDGGRRGQNAKRPDGSARMVLIDTSVWVRSFANLEPYTSELGRLADMEDVAGHELVFGELLIGDRRHREKFLRDYLLLYQAQRIPHGEVVELVRRRGLHGRGLGWIDAHLLASALAERMQLWTADADLSAAGKVLGVAYSPSRVPRV